MTANLFVPPAAEGLPQGALDSATEGADRLDAAALTPTGRNFLAHALVQLARDGWLRPEPGEGFEAVRERPTVEPQLPAVVSSPPATDRATVRQQVIDALLEARRPGLGGMTEADAVAYMADAVMAALPGDGRATILREAADRYEGILAKANTGQDPRYWTAVRDITLGLRRMADEAQQQEPAGGVRQPDTETPCGPAPDQCDAEAGEPCADHERQQAHAEGEHAFCGDECEPKEPHPTEADLAHGLAVLDRFHSQDTASGFEATVPSETELKAASNEVIHGCPPDGSGLTPCCGRTPFELPLGDRISSEASVTCLGADRG